jgi:hypothetical protein
MFVLNAMIKHMHYQWQDVVLAISILGFNFALIPSLFSKSKPALSTSILTAFLQLAVMIVYISLSLWYSAAMSFINFALWSALAGQRFTNSRSTTSKH